MSTRLGDPRSLERHEAELVPFERRLEIVPDAMSYAKAPMLVQHMSFDCAGVLRLG